MHLNNLFCMLLDGLSQNLDVRNGFGKIFLHACGFKGLSKPPGAKRILDYQNSTLTGTKPQAKFLKSKWHTKISVVGVDFISLPSFNISTADTLRRVHGVNFIGDTFGKIFIIFVLRASFLGFLRFFPLFLRHLNLVFVWPMSTRALAHRLTHHAQTQPSLTSKWLKHAPLIFSTVTLSYSKGKNSIAPTLFSFSRNFCT